MNLFGASDPFGGMRVIQSAAARSEDRPVWWVTFPKLARQPRSKRLMKKLLKRSVRRGTVWDPLAYQMGATLIVHPTLMPVLRSPTAARSGMFPTGET